MEQILEFTYQPQQTDFDAQLKPLYRDKQISSVDRIRLWKRLPELCAQLERSTALSIEGTLSSGRRMRVVKAGAALSRGAGTPQTAPPPLTPPAVPVTRGATEPVVTIRKQAEQPPAVQEPRVSGPPPSAKDKLLGLAKAHSAMHQCDLTTAIDAIAHGEPALWESAVRAQRFP